MESIEQVASVQFSAGEPEVRQSILEAGRDILRALARILPVGPDVAARYPKSSKWYEEVRETGKIPWEAIDLASISATAGAFAAVVEAAPWQIAGRALDNMVISLEDASPIIRTFARPGMSQNFQGVVRATRTKVNSIIPIIESYEQLQEIKAVRQNAEKVQREVLEVQEATEKAAGRVADVEISLFFDSYAKSRRWSYRLWSLVVACSLLATIGASYTGLNSEAQVSVSAEISKWALVIPLLALTGYAGRQASRNRSLAEWSELAFLRSSSIDAFVQRLPAEMADEVLHKFGLLVYTADRGADDAPNEDDVAQGLWSKVINGRQ
ncbi:hypothetical protein EV137_5490 [Kribbella pratensis]|uniref:DUF4231 domain-containing protein n=2 Tax=Kribbella pratensis TaxID=2512112 RepID=A0ABY2FAJ9_9ACTN|nr:hypothetical protein EV137_5490 [Kribbella pratensis]